MEYCDGKNLDDIIKEHKDKDELIEEKLIYNIIKQICLGIKEIHNKKIIHRDLKPENIFMNKNNEIKIGDFGISKELNSYKKYTFTNNKLGTLYYTAPEILDEGKYNYKADIYSLGCIIYELFHLSIYAINFMMHNAKKIDDDIYNPKWQELIDSLLQNEYKRPDINNVIEFIFCEDLRKFDEVPFQIEENQFKKINLENKQNKIDENINKKDSNLINNDDGQLNNNVYNLDKNIKIKNIIRKLSSVEIKEIKLIQNFKYLKSNYLIYIIFNFK